MLDYKELKELLTIEDLQKVQLEQDRISESLDLAMFYQPIDFIDGYLIICGPFCLESVNLYYCKRNSELFDYLSKPVKF